jgi:hypothetical protein
MRNNQFEGKSVRKMIVKTLYVCYCKMPSNSNYPFKGIYLGYNPTIPPKFSNTTANTMEYF